jgi:hypothetical protein
MRLRAFRKLARFQMRDRLRSLLYGSVEEAASFFESFTQTDSEAADPLLAAGHQPLFVVELQVGSILGGGQPREGPILLLPWVCFRGGGVPNQGPQLEPTDCMRGVV